jgi:MFS transporter, DHA1 family, inner membrane transport protein
MSGLRLSSISEFRFDFVLSPLWGGLGWGYYGIGIKANSNSRYPHPCPPHKGEGVSSCVTNFEFLSPMNFFQNSSINRIYVQTALQGMAYFAGTAFVFVYFLKAGMSLPVVFLAIGAMVLMRILFRLTLIPLVKKTGLRNGLIIGACVEALGFLFLANLNGVNAWMIIYLLITSLGTAYYYTCYHAVVARLGDDEHRGAQVSAREAIFAIAGIVGPLLGGFVLTLFGPFYAFLAAASFNVLAIVPLLHLPNMQIESDADIPRDSKLFGFGLACADGVVAMAVSIAWRLVLFITLGENFNAFGGAIAAASLVGAGMGLGVGRLIDLGHHRSSIKIGLGLMAGTVLLEAFGYPTVWGAVGANMIGAVAGPLYMSAIMAPFYVAGKASGCTFRFNVWGENGFDCGSGFGCLAAAAMAWGGFSSFWILITGLFGVAAAYAILAWHRDLSLAE